MKRRFDKAIVIGSDKNQEWMIPWWYYHYRQYNNYPVIFWDLGGLSNVAISFCKKYFCYLEVEEPYSKHVFLHKPRMLFDSPVEKIIWTDLDCEIRGNLEPVFVFCDSFCVSTERHGKKIWGKYNCGVIATNTENRILKRWVEEAENPTKKYPINSDQLRLDAVLEKESDGFVILPNQYNWTKKQKENKSALIFHWQGAQKKRNLFKSANVSFSFDFSKITTNINGGVHPSELTI